MQMSKLISQSVFGETKAQRAARACQDHRASQELHRELVQT